MRYHGKTVSEAISKAVRKSNRKPLSVRDCLELEKRMEILDQRIDELNRIANSLTSEIRAAHLNALGDAAVVGVEIGAMIAAPLKLLKIKRVAVRIRRLLRLQDVSTDWRELVVLADELIGVTDVSRRTLRTLEGLDNVQRISEARRQLRNRTNELAAEVHRLYRVYQDSECWRVFREAQRIG